MTSTTFDTNGLSLKPLTRPDRPGFVLDAPAGASVEPTRVGEATPFAANTAIYDKIHKREKRPIAMLVGGAAIILTGVVLFATSGHKRSTIGEAPAPAPTAASPVASVPEAPVPVEQTPMTPASPAPAAPAPTSRPASRAERAAPVRSVRAAPARPATRAEAPAETVTATPVLVAPAVKAVAPAPTIVAPPPVVVAPAPVETPSDTPQ